MKLFVLALTLAVANGARLENTYLPPSSARTAGGSGTFLATPFNQGASSGFKSSFAGGSSFGSRSGFGGGFGKTGGAFGGSFAGQGHGGGSGFSGHSGQQGFSGQQAYSGQQGYSGQQAYSGHGGRQIQILKYNNDNNGDGSYRFEYETENKISAQEVGQPKNIGGEAPTVVQGSFQFVSPEGQNIGISYVADENGFQPVGDHLPTPPPIPEAILKSIQFNEASGTSGDDGSYRDDNSGAYRGDGSGSYSGKSGFGGQGGFGAGQGGFGAGQGGFGSGQGTFGAGHGGFGGSQGGFSSKSSFSGSGFGAKSGFGGSGFGATNKQYIAPSANNGGYRY